MRFFRTRTEEKEYYVWYHADKDKCLSGTMEEYEIAKAGSKKECDFQIICKVGNDQKAVTELTRNVNENYQFK